MKSMRQIVAGFAVALVALFGMGIGSSVSADTNTNLGDLIILDQLFGNNNGTFGNSGNLGDLIVLDQLFGSSEGDLFGTGNDLGKLFILDRVLGDGNGVKNIGDLFVLDRLFGQDIERVSE